MQNIIPHLWYDKEAKQAAEFYVKVFGGDSKITTVKTLHNTPSGDCDIVSFTLWGSPFVSISAGPHFKLNPSVSFMVNFDPSQMANAATRINEMWAALLDGGKQLMPLDKYPFSERYGWVQDKFGLTWQLILTNPTGEERPVIVPSLLFTGEKFRKAEAAREFYLSVFKDSKPGTIVKYPVGSPEPHQEGAVMFSDYKLNDQWFVAMDGPGKHDFTFNEAVSFIVRCNTQEEIDYYWEKLSDVPESEQCGWLKDRFGLSWQIMPTMMDALMNGGDQEKIDRVTQAFLKMKKFDIVELEKAATG